MNEQKNHFTPPLVGWNYSKRALVFKSRVSGVAGKPHDAPYDGEKNNIRVNVIWRLVTRISVIAIGVNSDSDQSSAVNEVCRSASSRLVR